MMLFQFLTPSYRQTRKVRTPVHAVPAVFLCGVLDWFTLLLRLYSTHSGPIIHILWLVKAVGIRRRAG